MVDDCFVATPTAAFLGRGTDGFHLAPSAPLLHLLGVEAGLVGGVLFPLVGGALAVVGAELGVLRVLLACAEIVIERALELAQVRLVDDHLFGLAPFTPLRVGGVVVQLPRGAAAREVDLPIEGFARKGFTTLRLVGSRAFFDHLDLDGRRLLLRGRLGVRCQADEGQADEGHPKQGTGLANHGYPPQLVANTKHRPTWP